MWSGHHGKWENEVTRETRQGRRAGQCPHRGAWSRVVCLLHPDRDVMLAERARRRVKQGAGFAPAGAIGRWGEEEVGMVTWVVFK